MRSLLKIASLLVVAVLMTGLVALAAESDKEKAAPPQAVPEGDTTKALVRIAFDPQWLLNETVLQQYLQSPDVLGAAITKIREKMESTVAPPDSMFGVDSVLEGASEGQMLLMITARTPKNDPPMAKDFLELVLENLERLMGKTQRDDVFWHDCRLRVEGASANLTAARDELSHFLLEANGVDLSLAGVMAKATNIQAEEEKVLIDLAGKRARQNLLEERMARIAQETDSKIKDDPVVAELEKVVTLREEELEVTKQLANQPTRTAPTAIANPPLPGKPGATSADVAACEAKVAEARVELLKRREAASAAGRELLAKLRDEEVALSLDIKELEARGVFLLERKESVGGFLNLARQYEALTLAKETAQHNYEYFQQRLQEAYEHGEQRSHNLPVVRVVIQY